jgi:hypothetical protein
MSDDNASTAAPRREMRVFGYEISDRNKRRAAWAVAIAGASGLVVGAVSTSAQAATFVSLQATVQPASIVPTIPPITAPGGTTHVTVETVETTLEPESIEQLDKFVPEGTRKVVSTGEPGLQLSTYTVTTVDGIEVDRRLLASVVEKEPTHDVVSIGTLPVPSRPAITPGSNRDIGKQLAAARGWTGIEWQCLDNLFERESNWRHLVANPSSGAYGIPQALPGSKMASAGADWKTNPATQITWGLRYIKGRYGTPCGAWAAWTYRSPHWY